jgi:hypothetical protein
MITVREVGAESINADVDTNWVAWVSGWNVANQNFFGIMVVIVTGRDTLAEIVAVFHMTFQSAAADGHRLTESRFASWNMANNYTVYVFIPRAIPFIRCCWAVA